MRMESRAHIDRRTLLAGATVGLGGLLIGCGGSGGLSGGSTGTTSTTGTTGTTGGTGSENDLLNFALNLEYLEAEYYLRALTGSGLSSADIGSSAGTVTGGASVPFATAQLRTMCQEFANEETLHVRTLRAALGSNAISRPTIDFTAAFTAIATQANIPGFDPFVDEQSWLVGAFLFEDLGVTAYAGAMASMTDIPTIRSAAGIMGAESYHAGAIRKTIYDLGGDPQTNAGKISSLRASLGNGKDQQISNGALSNVSATDTSTGEVYARTTREVLNILYLTSNATKGGFFPNGANGNITS